MLNSSYFELMSVDHDDKLIDAMIKIAPDHAIFNGHFPGQPVVPGACMLQILKEVFQNALRINIRLLKADHIKFLTIIDPASNNVLRLNVNYAITELNIKTNAVILLNEMACFKFQGVFSILQS